MRPLVEQDFNTTTTQAEWAMLYGHGFEAETCTGEVSAREQSRSTILQRRIAVRYAVSQDFSSSLNGMRHSLADIGPGESRVRLALPVVIVADTL